MEEAASLHLYQVRQSSMALAAEEEQMTGLPQLGLEVTALATVEELQAEVMELPIEAAAAAVLETTGPLGAS
jgi:hypothetical protein